MAYDSRYSKSEANRRQHRIGVDANRPIVIELGPNQGAFADTVADPDVIAGSGASWVRVNFILGPWVSTEDRMKFQGHNWRQAYHKVIEQFHARGLNIYGLVGAEAVRSNADHRLNTIFRRPEPHTSGYDKATAHAWIQHYAATFGDIAREFHQKVTHFESFNEPDDWHGANTEWVHPTWFAVMLQAIHNVVKVKLGLHQIKLISGPLQGLANHVDGSHARDYLHSTYLFGRERFGWGTTQPYPFDAVAYHLYLRPDFSPIWADQVREVRRTSNLYIARIMDVIREFEGTGATKKLFLSEVGWTSGDNSEAHLEFQARNLILALTGLVDNSAVELVFWFCTQDFSLSPTYPQFYGLYRTGPLNESGRKPAFYAFKDVCESQLTGVKVFPFRNQELINAFYAAAADCGEVGWDWIEQAGLTHLAETRQAWYKGLAIELLSGLSAEVKALITSKLP